MTNNHFYLVALSKVTVVCALFLHTASVEIKNLSWYFFFFYKRIPSY